MSTYSARKQSQLGAELFHMFRFVETLREMKPDMPLHLASVFLLIAMKPGIGQRDLIGLVDISQAGVSRNVTALTAIDRHGKPGLNFVVQRRDPTDARNTMLYLTDEGDAFLRKLIASFRDKAN